MKISELNTKSFLGGTGAAANSYVLINYEDNSTSEPVTYKASLQELGKAIANDLKLPSATVSGNTIIDFKVKGVSNGAYTEKTVGVLSNGGPSMGDVSVAVNTAINGLASTGYVTDAVDGLASTGYVQDAIQGLTSTGDIEGILIDKAVITASELQSNVDPIINNYLVESSVTWHHEDDPDETVSILFCGNYGKILMKDSSAFTPLPHIAYLSTSDQKICIRDGDDVFQGFLSST